MTVDRNRLVVVDDDASVREALANYLRSKGFAVRAVADAVALDRALEQERADLVVLDLMLPGETGYRSAGGCPPVGSRC